MTKENEDKETETPLSQSAVEGLVSNDFVPGNIIGGETLHDMFKAGWRIEPTSCGCGGSWAWLKPRESGAMEMVGCVCHKTIDAVKAFNLNC